MKNNNFPQREHVKKEDDFSRILKSGVRINYNGVMIYYSPNSLDYNRLGIIVAKKRFKNSSERNHLKRLVREAYRLNRNDIPTGFDILINVKQNKGIGFKELSDILIKLKFQIK
jgi:ribonuclease P protein component